MLGSDLYTVWFRPEGQESSLAGGQGRGEVIVPLEDLTKARKLAISLKSKIPNIYLHGRDFRGKEVFAKSFIALYMGATIVVPDVDIVTLEPLENYRGLCWPGLDIYSERYDSLVGAAELFQFRVPPRKLLDLDRGAGFLKGKVRTK